MGALVEQIPDGGICIDIIREGHDFLIQISGKGEISVVTSQICKPQSQGGIYMPRIGENFFTKLGQILEDPITDTGIESLSDGFPLAAQELVEFPDAKGVNIMSTRVGFFLTEPVQRCRNGFKKIAYPVPAEELKDMNPSSASDWIIRKSAAIRSCADLMLVRDIQTPGLASLHRVKTLSPSHIRKTCLTSGTPLIDIYRTMTRPQCTGTNGPSMCHAT
jgi:hypothetical protein